MSSTILMSSTFLRDWNDESVDSGSSCRMALGLTSSLSANAQAFLSYDLMRWMYK